MIIPSMETYNLKKYGEKDSFGQSTPVSIEKTAKISISSLSTMISDNLPYSKAQFIGFTHDKDIDDSYIICRDDGDLKVLYNNKSGRLNVLYLVRIS